ncbi:MAG: phospho-N-acetylmuramoyl-pentapeptide-transferase [Candidatus Omnitrophica bacterium]|nr:phospho-N-acetylmuramoyl-pentapeptide-transferase [Candidatus Omnitrophota bacterium]
MLANWLCSLTFIWFGFNVFRYITVRAVLATFTSLFLSILIGPVLIKKLKNFCHPTLLEFKENKSKTPTMGGWLIIGTTLVSVFLWADLENIYIWLLVLVMTWLGVFGFWDDYLKLKTKSHKGMRPAVKIIGQAAIGFIVGFILYYHPTLGFNPSVAMPFLKKVVLPLGCYYILFSTFILVATSNAVNLTDGMDGLAIGLILMVVLAYGGIAYLAGNVNFATYLNIFYVRGAGEVSIFCGALVGSSLGFLWYNCFPAQVFMGDVGSLPLGGIVGLLSIIVKQEISLIFVGGIFVAEALSVILQVIFFRTRGKRIFLMTPIHHHFELTGLPETKVVVRFWIVGLILALFTAVTLKIR